jgi:hypothetical protein
MQTSDVRPTPARERPETLWPPTSRKWLFPAAMLGFDEQEWDAMYGAHRAATGEQA